MSPQLEHVLQLLGPSTGGIRAHVATLSGGLAERGVSAPIVGPVGVVDGLARQAGTVPIPAGLDPVRLAWARRALKPWRSRTQVVHAHGLKAGWTALGGSPARPLVVTVHNRVLDASAGPLTGIQRVLERQILRRADRVVALTTSMAEELSQFVPEERIRVALPASPPPVVTESRELVRSRLGVTESTPLVVCVARLHPQKDLPTLLRAWQRVHDSHPEAVLVIVGDGPDRADLEALHAELRLGMSARFLGARPHAVNELAAADVSVMTSRWEGAALVLAESTQLGVPMVSTPTGLAPDLLAGGAAGVIVGFGDDVAVADALCGMLDAPDAAAEMGLRGQAHARSVFEPGRAIEEIMATYREVLG